MTTLNARMFQHRMTSAEIAASATIFAAGEFIYDTDAKEVRVGDGVNVPALLKVIGPGVLKINGLGPGIVNITGLDIPFTPTGGIGATNVYAAILEAKTDAVGSSIQNAIADALGDMLYATANDTWGKLPIGPSGNVLTVSGGVPVWSPAASGTGDPAWVFRPENFGAVGDGVTDDSVAIRACVDAAVAFATNVTQLPNGQGHYFFKIIFRSTTYLCNTLAQRSVTSGGQNALVCLPHNPMTSQKLIGVLEGAGAGGFLMFGQTVPYRTGTVIRTTLTGLSSQTVNGVSVPPSIFGFPRYTAGNLWSNVLIVTDGITAQAPLDPGIIGFDYLRASQAWVRSATAIADGPQTGAGNVPGSNPTNGLGIGIFLPDSGNNDLSLVDRFSCEGFQTGLVHAEHATIKSAALIYCQDGIFVGGSGAPQHGVYISNLSIEASGRHGFLVAATGATIPIFVGAMQTETLGSNDVNDTGNVLHGEIHWFAVSRTAPSLSGAANVAVINERMNRATIATGTVQGIAFPAIPVSGSPLVNPYYRNATVQVNGGTVSAILVGGVVTGATGGPIRLPTGFSITLNYSVSPTSWVWTLD